MKIVTQVNEWQAIRKQLQNKTIGFVPTMGHLHMGHLSLCKRAQAENDVTVVSIFVNPTQFNQTRDFEHYPRTIENDAEMLIEHQVDYLFTPSPDDIYPDAYQIQVSETDISLTLEGEFRPGHFTGMLTVVLKLLNLMQANRAYFGEKDFQQLLLVKKMATALFLPTEIIGCETMRAADGLALSSRNSRLNQQERQLAVQFSQLLKSNLSLEEIREKLEEAGFKVEYVAEKWQRRLGAVVLGETRLIDNISVKS